MEYDFLIVGSGFGGSVSALRLVEKGYSVAVLEQGRRVTSSDMERADRELRSLLWAPSWGCRGFFQQHIFQHVGIVGGVGVGGGSLVYAAVLLEPKQDFFRDPAWSEFGVDWQAELGPHYETAKRMLGVTVHERMEPMDELLRLTARSMGAEDTFSAPPLGIFFGNTAETTADPFFAGKGPERTGCCFCGGCLTGCAHGSKNSLDKNYLHLAEALGAKIVPEREVTSIRPATGGGYEVLAINPLGGNKPRPEKIRAQNVVISAGVIGTLKLLLRCRDELQTLPRLSSELGKVVRTNSEAIVGILGKDERVDLTSGTTISSHFYPNPRTHITQNRFPKGYTFFKWHMGPLVDGRRPLLRALKTLLRYVLHPIRSTISWRARDWHKRLSVLTVMQSLDNQLSFRYGRSLFSLFRKRLISEPIAGKRAPTYIAEANEAARIFADHAGAEPLNVIAESLAGMSVTAHILGGCPMGLSAEQGVIDPLHQVHGYPGLYVVDGSAIPANVGVNPSLTITAMAERCMSRVPPKKSVQSLATTDCGGEQP